MIKSRRKYHFYTVVFLTLSLPLVFFLGLLWRPTIPTADEQTDKLFAKANFFSAEDNYQVIASENLTVNNINILTELVNSDQGIRYLSFQPSQPLQFADVLVYLTDKESETVSKDAILLGQLSGVNRRCFPIAQQSQKEPRYLLFYSLGQDKAIASIPLPSSLSPSALGKTHITISH